MRSDVTRAPGRSLVTPADRRYNAHHPEAYWPRPPGVRAMTRPRLLAAFPAAELALLAACNKKDGGGETAVQPVPPDDRTNGPPEMRAKGKDQPKVVMPGDRDVPIDLSAHLIRGEIGIPEGTADVRLLPGSCQLQCGPTFDIEIQKTDQPLSARRSEWQPGVERWARDEPAVLVAELKGQPGPAFAFESRAKLGEASYRVRSTP